MEQRDGVEAPTCVDCVSRRRKYKDRPDLDRCGDSIVFGSCRAKHDYSGLGAQLKDPLWSLPFCINERADHSGACGPEGLRWVQAPEPAPLPPKQKKVNFVLVLCWVAFGAAMAFVVTYIVVSIHMLKAPPLAELPRGVFLFLCAIGAVCGGLFGCPSSDDSR